jgi:hypothetical protein
MRLALVLDRLRWLAEAFGASAPLMWVNHKGGRAQDWRKKLQNQIFAARYGRNVALFGLGPVITAMSPY